MREETAIANIIEKCCEEGIFLWVEGEKLRFKAPKGVFTEDLKNEVKSKRETIIDYINKAERQTITPDADHQYEPFLLTEVQSSYLLGRNDFYDYGGIGCHAYVEVKLPRCDRDRMQKAFHQVIHRHPMLRAAVTRDGYQRIVKDFRYPKIEERMGENLQEEVWKTRKRLEQKVYDIEDPFLYELVVTTAGEESVVHFSMDMLLADSVSMGILLKDLMDFYTGRVSEKESPRITFRDVVLFGEAVKNKPSMRVKRTEDKAYWLKRLGSLPDMPHLPLGERQTSGERADFAIKSFCLERQQWQAFSRNAGENRITPSSAIMAVYAHVLDTWCANSGFCINVTLMMRPDYHPDINHIVGDFTSNTILEVACEKAESFVENARTLQTQLWEDMEHRAFSGIEVLREWNRRKKYDVLMPYVYTSTLGIENLDSSDIEVTYKASQTPQVFIDCQVGESAGNLSVIWTLRKGTVDETVADIMFESFCEMIEALSQKEELWREPAKDYIPHKQRLFYEDILRQCRKDEEQWRLKYAEIDEEKCENILKEHLAAEDAAVISGEKADIYILPEKEENPHYFAERDRKIKKRNREEAARLCDSVQWDSMLADIRTANEVAILDIMRTFRKAGAFLSDKEIYSQKELEIMLQAAPDYRYLLERWLKALKREGYILEHNGKYRAAMTDVEERYRKLMDQAKRIARETPGYKGMESYLLSSAEKLADSISGKINPVEFLFPKGESQTAHEIYHDLFAAKMLNRLCLKTIETAAEGAEKIRVLEVGSGVGGTSDELIPFLADYPDVEYYFTDISQYFLQEAKAKYKQYDFVNYGIYDLNEPCEKQGLRMGSFDFIVCANTFHNAIDGFEAMKKVKQALKPNGCMIFLDCIFESASLLASKGMLHHGAIEDTRREDKRIFFTDEEWRSMIDAAGLELADAYPRPDDPFAAFNLKYYAVHNRNGYKDVGTDKVWDLLREELPSEEKLGKLTVSSELPLNREGRIDKNALESKTQDGRKRKGSGSKDMPATKLEEEIAAVWKEVLELDEIPGVTDSFFELGGDSLLASMAITKIRGKVDRAREVEWNDLMNLLLKNNTVRKLASAIDSINPSEDCPHFAMIYQRGTKTPENVWAFFVNGTATMPIYQTLFEKLKKAIPETDAVVGLHCGDPDRFLKISPGEVIDCMAKRNAEYLISLGAKNYSLIGHCFGGGVAIETGRLMKAAGIENLRVTTIDTKRFVGHFDNDIFFEKGFGEMYGADMAECGYDMDDELFKDTMREFEKKNGRFLTSDEMCVRKEVPEEIRRCCKKLKEKTVEERLARIFRQVESKLPGGFDDRVFKNSYFMFAKILADFMAYEPEKYDGRVDAFLCRDQSGFFVTGDLESLDYARQAVTGEGRRIWIDGDHFTCMETPNVEKIVEVLTGE